MHILYRILKVFVKISKAIGLKSRNIFRRLPEEVRDLDAGGIQFRLARELRSPRSRQTDTNPMEE